MAFPGKAYLVVLHAVHSRRGSVSHEGVRHGTERGFKLFPGIGLREKPCVCLRVRHGRPAERRCTASRGADAVLIRCPLTTLIRVPFWLVCGSLLSTCPFLSSP